VVDATNVNLTTRFESAKGLGVLPNIDFLRERIHYVLIVIVKNLHGKRNYFFSQGISMSIRRKQWTLF
jgi:hypothetical protein